MTQKEIQDITDALDFASSYVSYVKENHLSLHEEADDETEYKVTKARKHMDYYDKRLIAHKEGKN
jgi:hypothetical protein